MRRPVMGRARCLRLFWFASGAEYAAGSPALERLHEEDLAVGRKNGTAAADYFAVHRHRYAGVNHGGKTWICLFEGIQHLSHSRGFNLDDLSTVREATQTGPEVDIDRRHSSTPFIHLSSQPGPWAASSVDGAGAHRSPQRWHWQ
ncbi:exported hypothetical protein [Sinorhizobium medicae]|uniref:Uncharacterized protein n=1 Tax=Sinorhizobium medicae TaxID=110321 RepID=A0A508X777_9HYPH|nr:exported hypothetical protein [Sinorhizobium medicae]